MYNYGAIPHCKEHGSALNFGQDEMFKEKYKQLIDDGFCIIEDVLSKQFLNRCRKETDRLCQSAPEENRNRFQSQGSMLSAMSHPIFAELIAWQKSIDALRSMGFKNPTFTDGYIISKPPHSPKLFWHYDWFAWDDPTVYYPKPQQVFLMYYLIDTTTHNGCLRTIPGSHLRHNPLHDHLHNPHAQEISIAEDTNRPEFSTRPDEVDVPIKAGELLIGDARLLHASHANQSNQRRTVITLWFQPDFCILPERIKAQMVAKTQTVPSNWPVTAKKMVTDLHPRYNGQAEPYGRILYKPKPRHIGQT